MGGSVLALPALLVGGELAIDRRRSDTWSGVRQTIFVERDNYRDRVRRYLSGKT
jgi:hypothetical protein